MINVGFCMETRLVCFLIRVPPPKKHLCLTLSNLKTVASRQLEKCKMKHIRKNNVILKTQDKTIMKLQYFDFISKLSSNIMKTITSKYTKVR